MKSIEEQYKKLKNEGNAEGASELIRGNFEELMRRINKSELVGKEGHIFKILYRRKDQKDFQTFIDADTIEEAWEMLKSLSKENEKLPKDFLEELDDYEFVVKYELPDKQIN